MDHHWSPENGGRDGVTKSFQARRSLVWQLGFPSDHFTAEEALEFSVVRRTPLQQLCVYPFRVKLFWLLERQIDLIPLIQHSGELEGMLTARIFPLPKTHAPPKLVVVSSLQIERRYLTE